MTPLPLPAMDSTALRKCATFAKSPLDGTSLKTKANVLPQRRKYRTGRPGNADHNCSRKRSAIYVRGFKMRTEGGIEVQGLEMPRRAQPLASLEEAIVARPKL